MKTRKTAGTSIQTALTDICGPDDIISSDLDTVGRNENKSCWDGHPHPHLWDVGIWLVRRYLTVTSNLHS